MALHNTIHPIWETAAVKNVFQLTTELPCDVQKGIFIIIIHVKKILMHFEIFINYTWLRTSLVYEKDKKKTAKCVIFIS